MKRVLIISPYFPPSNAADMQRIRMSLPYFEDFGWEAEVVCVDPIYSEMVKDDLLLESIPKGTKIHQVEALSKKWTGKFGLGSLALRSMWFYRKKVNSLLRTGDFDLVYFSTTQFPLCILGRYWKWKFSVPYVIDMQDPWHSEYYQDKPKNQQPAKYWFSYRLNKWLEPVAMKKVGGLISVSQAYIDDLKCRYPIIRNIPAEVITFGVCEKDFHIAMNFKNIKSWIEPNPGKINIVYVGRGGYDMYNAIRPVFKALSKGMKKLPGRFSKFHFYFIGTSYARAGSGVETIRPLAKKYSVSDQVSEFTDRIGFYENLKTLSLADILFLPCSDDPKYSASKLYPYILSEKPLLSVLHRNSNAVDILKSCSSNLKIHTFPADDNILSAQIYDQLLIWSDGLFEPIHINRAEFEKYNAKIMTKNQVAVFDKLLN